MADVSIDSTIGTATGRGMRSIVFTTTSVGYQFYIDSGGTFVYSKTSDGGATWGAAVTINSATTQVAFDVWYDRWTPGDTGTKIHCWYFDTTNDKVFYRQLDTNGDSLGTERTAFTGASAVAGNNAYVSGTKTRSGYLYCCSAIDASNEQYFGRSTDGGTTWGAALSATFQEANPDHALLFPATGTGDDNDCWAIYHDSSATALTMKMWDSSAVAQVESSTIQTIVAVGTDLTVYQYPFSGAIRESDGHLIFVSSSDRDTATADMQVWEVSGVTAASQSGITHLTDITTDKDDNYNPAIFINKGNGDLYVAYNGKRDGSETIGTTTKVYYTKSTDNGSTWSAGDTAYMEGSTAAVLQVWVPLTGPFFYSSWRTGTTLNGNKVNAIAVKGEAAGSSAGAATPSGVSGSVSGADGSSAGVGSSSVVGVALWDSIGSSSGVGASSVVGTALWDSSGSSSGAAVAAAVSAALWDSVGASTGAGTAAANSSAQAQVVGSSDGLSAVAGVGVDFAQADASSAGIGSAAGVASNIVGADGSSSGAAVAAAVSAALVQATGASSGAASSSVIAAVIAIAAGSSAGSGAASASAQIFFVAIASAAGTGAAIGQSDAPDGEGGSIAAAAGIAIAIADSETVFARKLLLNAVLLSRLQMSGADTL